MTRKGCLEDGAASRGGDIGGLHDEQDEHDDEHTEASWSHTYHTPHLE